MVPQTLTCVGVKELRQADDEGEEDEDGELSNGRFRHGNHVLIDSWHTCSLSYTHAHAEAREQINSSPSPVQSSPVQSSEG